MNRTWLLNGEPRPTILAEMLAAWKGRNAARRKQNMATYAAAADYWRAEEMSCQDTLCVLFRVRAAAKGKHDRF
jgi:hypothetical protein